MIQFISITIVVIFAWLILNAFKKSIPKSYKPSSINMRPEEILSDLDKRIERYCDYAINTKLLYEKVYSNGNSDNKFIKSSNILSEEFLVTTCAEVILDIMDGFSQQYLDLLKTVIDEENLESYINSRVYLSIYTYGIEYNMKAVDK